MPAKTEKQRGLFGAALSLKRGKTAAKNVTPQARRLARTMSDKKLAEFAQKIKPKTA